MLAAYKTNICAKLYGNLIDNLKLIMNSCFPKNSKSHIVPKKLKSFTLQNTEISPSFLVWKLSVSKKFPHQEIR